MKKWQKNVLNTKLPSLIDNISCNTELLTELKSNSLLTKEEVNQIERKETPQEEVKHMLQVLETRTGSYCKLLQIVAKCGQTGAQKILAKGIDKEGLCNQIVRFNGKKYKLKNLLATDKQLSLKKLLGHKPDISEYIQYCAGETEQYLLKEIPKVAPHYIPQKLYSKRYIKSDVFWENLPDIFLFIGLDRIELTEIASFSSPQAKTLCSSKFSATNRARFVLLKSDTDIQKIFNLVEVPVHLIKPVSDKKYIVEETWGGIQGIKPCLKEENLEFSTSNITFAAGNSKNIVLICDIPGIGKTQLVFKLLKEISSLCPNTVTLYIGFPSQLKEFQNTFKNKQDVRCPIDKLLDTFSLNNFSYRVLSYLVYTLEWKVCLVLDGYDNLLSEDPKLAKQFLKRIKYNKHISHLFITSRPSVKHWLENVLGKISYSICRLSPDDQLALFSKFPVFSNHVDAAEMLSHLSLGSFSVDSVLDSNRITSVPFYCVLLAETLSSRSDIASTHKIPRLDIGPEEAKQYLFKMFRKFVQTSYSLASPDDLQQAKKYFTMAALRTKFDSIATTYENFFEVPPSFKFAQNTRLAFINILEENTKSIVFTHEMFSEFIIAEFVTSQLISKSPEGLLEFVFRKIFSYQTRSEFENPISFPSLVVNNFVLYQFTYNVICFFINNLLQMKSFEFELTEDIVAHLSSQIDNGEVLYNILLCCALDGCSGILRLITQLIHYVMKRSKNKKQKRKLVDFFSKSKLESQCTNLLIVSSHFANRDTVDAICHIFTKCFDVDISFLSKKSVNNVLTPLHLGIFKGDYNIVEYFLPFYKLNWQTRGFVHTCIIETHGKPLNEKKIVLELIIRTLNGSVNEKCENILPIGVRKIHLDLLKILISNKANIFYKNSQSSYISFSTIFYMCPNRYHKLVEFLLKTRVKKAKKLFSLPNSFGRTTLHEVLACKTFQIKVETLKLLINALNITVDRKDSKGDTLLSLAISGENSPEIVTELLKLEPDIFQPYRNDRNIVDVVYVSRNENVLLDLLPKVGRLCSSNTKDTLLHLSAFWHQQDQFHQCVKLIIEKDMTWILQAKNAEARTPLHVAIKRMEILSKTLNLISRADQSCLNCIDSGGNNLIFTAVSSQHSLSFIKSLVDLGVNFHHVNNDSENLLHIAVKEELEEHFDFFARLNVDGNLPDKNGFTPSALGEKKLFVYLKQFSDIDVNRAKKLLKFIKL